MCLDIQWTWTRTSGQVTTLDQMVVELILQINGTIVQSVLGKMSVFFFSNMSWNSLYCIGMFVDVVVSLEAGIA